MNRFYAFLFIGLLTINVLPAQTVTKTYTFDTPGITLLDDGFSRLDLKNCHNMGMEGEPLLPRLGCELILPQGTQAIAVNIVSIRYSEDKENIQIVPASRPFPISEPAPPDYKPVPNKDIYNSDGPWPRNIVSGLSTQFMAGYSIAVFNICPVRYFPARNTFIYIKSIDIEIETAPLEHSIVVPAVPSPVTVKRLKKIADNPETINDYIFNENNKNAEADVLIITKSSFFDAFTPYIQYKNSKGYLVEIISVEDIYSDYTGVDQQEKIRNCIIDYYQNKGITYVLLGGDADAASSTDNIVPDRGLFVDTGFGYSDDDIPSDMYYCCLDGNWNQNGNNHYGEPGEEDLYAEVFVGRFCVDNTVELTHMINKVIRYQENPVVDDIQKALMIGEQLDDITFGGDYKEEIATGSSLYGFETAGIPADYDITRFYEMTGSWNKNNVFNQFNSVGCHLINHLGHSSNTYNMKMHNGDVTTTNFTNNGITHGYAIGYSQGCYNGSFDNRNSAGNYVGDCFSEKITGIGTAEVATIGNSRYGWYQQGSTNGASQYFDRQFFDAIFGEDMTEIGMVNGDSKEDNASYILYDQVLRWCCYETNLFGDPSMDIWTAQPSTFAASYLNEIPANSQSFDIATGVPFTRIGMMQNDTLIGKAVANENGYATVIFNQPVSATGGNVAMALTAHNRLPFYDTLTVITGQPFVVFDSVYINDENGNNNGYADYGEELLLGISMANNGDQTAQNVSVTLSSNDPFITLPADVVTFGNIAPGTSVFLEDAFDVTISDSIPDGHEMKVNVLAVTPQKQSWASYFMIKVNAPNLQITALTISDSPGGNGNGTADPGENVTLIFQLINNGHAPSPGLSLTCNSSNPDVILLTHQVFGNPLPQGALGSVQISALVANTAVAGSYTSIISHMQYGAYEHVQYFTCPIGRVREDFETGDFSKFDWQFGGDEDWSITTYYVQHGIYGARSGNISDNSNSEIHLVYEVAADDSISFYRKTSSEQGYDFLSFSIDDEEQGSWSGIRSWEKFTFPVSAGTHTFSWMYEKDPAVSGGDDLACIDNIIFPPNVPIVPAYEVDIKVLLEGPYTGDVMESCPGIPLSQPYDVSPWDYDNNEHVAQIPEGAVDWVLIELRDAPDAASATGASIIGQRAVFLLTDGTIADLDGVSYPAFNAPVSQNLFIVIRHRNHLAVMTANPPEFTNHVYSYDFTVSAEQAFGTNAQKELTNGLFGMFGGDANADGIININDKVTLWNQNAGKAGYLPSDVNLNGQSDNPDKNTILLRNFGKATFVPE